ncbi:MAG TPA: DUF2339 domain-containing protein [Pyrinomonadaceae bacterium]|nr:DUF2339 domain-containing protein [Pyrinomonadaceae bacterium]
MPEDEHPPAADDARDDGSGTTGTDGDGKGDGNGGGATGAANVTTDDAADLNGHMLARLAQLERAFGEQSARLRSIERRLGLVTDTRKPQPFEQGEQPAAGTASTEEMRDEQARASVRPGENREAARDDAATPFGTPHAKTRRQEADANARAVNARDAGMGATETATSVLPARRDLEQLIGGSLLLWVGIIAVSLAVGFILKYAFDNDWIGERGQVLFGALVGGGILFAAERLRARGYRSYAYVLSGGGILILYLTVYAARVFYELIGVVPAFLLMIAVTTTAVLLAARYHAYPIAVLGLIGGFMTPALLSTGVDNQIGLFGYVALLDSGVLALAYFKRWRSLNHLAFIATALTFAGWSLAYYEDRKLWPTLFFLTLFFLMFNALGVVYNVVKRRPARWFDISLIITNATLFFAASYALLEPAFDSLLGSYALVWSAFYVLLFYFTHQRHRADKLLALSYVGAAVTFFTIAAAIQLDQHWVTIAWAMEALMLTWIGLRSDADAPRYVALPVFAFAMLHWFTADMFEFAYREGETFVPLLNRRAVSAAALVATLGGAVWLYRRAGERIERGEREMIGAVLILAANVLALILLTVDANDYFNARTAFIGADDPEAYRANENARQFTLTVLWTFYALCALVVGTKRRVPVLRYAALAWLAVTGAKIIALDAGFYNAAWHLPLFNQTFAAFAAFIAALWYAGRLYTRPDKIDESERRAVLNGIIIAANVYAITALSLEAVGHFEKLIRAGALAETNTRDLRLAQGLSLSLVWTLYGGAMLLYGHRRANRLLRIMALLLLTATALKVFFLDLAVLEKFYRIVSFLVLGAILLAVSFLYQQKQRASKAEGG